MEHLRKYIVVNLQFEAIHDWPDCNIPEVYYLKFKHRHIFHIKCIKEVSHSDRDIEIIKFKHTIQEYLYNSYPRGDLGSMSCEMIAEKLLKKFDLKSCDVLEDGENGAIICQS